MALLQFLGPLVQLSRTRHAPGAIPMTSGAIIPYSSWPCCNSYDLWCNYVVLAMPLVQFLGPLVQLSRTRHAPGAIPRTSGAIIPYSPCPWCNSYDLWCNYPVLVKALGQFL